MTLIILLAVLYVQWFLGQRVVLSDFDWFTAYIHFFNEKLAKAELMQGFVGLAIVILPIALVVLTLLALLDEWVFGLLKFVFSLAVFFYCVDATNPAARLESFFKGNKAEQEVKDYLGTAVPKTDGGIARKVANTIFTRSLHNIFSMTFWFVLLGPFGVTVYFLVSLVGQGSIKGTKPMSDAAHSVQAVMDWVPVRLVGLSFALMGSFGSVFVYLIKHIHSGLAMADELITHYGLLAINANPRESKEADHKEASEASELVYRSIIVWVVVVAVITLASWF